MTAAEMINLGEKKSPIRENFEYGRQRMEQIGKEKALFLLPDFAYLLNIVLDILFIKTFNMGVAGAAIATVFAQMMSFVVCMAYMKKYYSTLFINMLHLQFDKAELKKSLKIGTPAMIQQVFVSIGFMSLQFLINGFGTDCMAAYTAASKVDAFAEMPALNLEQAMTNFTAQNLGAKRKGKVLKGGKYALIIGMAISVCIFTIKFNALLIWIAGGIDALSTWIAGEEILPPGCYGKYWEWMELVGVSYDKFIG